MKFIPEAVTRTIAQQAVLARKNSPTILFGAGVASMVGSTVLACRATLKLDEVIDELKANKNKAERAKAIVESGEVPEGTTYTDNEMKRDLAIIHSRAVVAVVKLYAPAVILGGVGVACLTKSHQILRDRNAALTAAYIALDQAFIAYRSRVVDRYGEDTDREMRHGSERVDFIDEETGKSYALTVADPGEPSGYARWFDDTNTYWEKHDDGINWFFLRSQQNWANDVLRTQGHLFLNDVYGMLGFPHTSAGAIVGWIYDRENDVGDNCVDFGIFDEGGNHIDFFRGGNGREGSILLDFNVDGPIWQLLDERNTKKTGE